MAMKQQEIREDQYGLQRKRHKKNGQPSGLRQMLWVRRKNAESVDLKPSKKCWSLNEAKS